MKKQHIKRSEGWRPWKVAKRKGWDTEPTLNDTLNARWRRHLIAMLRKIED